MGPWPLWLGHSAVPAVWPGWPGLVVVDGEYHVLFEVDVVREPGSQVYPFRLPTVLTRLEHFVFLAVP